MYQENDETDHKYSYILPKLNTDNRTMVVGASVKAGGVVGGGGDYCGKCDVAAGR